MILILISKMFVDMRDVFYISIETVSTRIKDLMYIAIYAIQVFSASNQNRTPTIRI